MSQKRLPPPSELKEYTVLWFAPKLSSLNEKVIRSEKRSLIFKENGNHAAYLRRLSKHASFIPNFTVGKRTSIAELHVTNAERLSIFGKSAVSSPFTMFLFKRSSTLSALMSTKLQYLLKSN